MGVWESIKMLGCFYANYKQQSTNSLSADYTGYTDLVETVGPRALQNNLGNLRILRTVPVLTAKMVRDYCSGRSGQKAF
jgi:hypothetical protein